MSQKAPASGSRTNVGCVRSHNEDSLIVQPPLYAVADGMGGHAAGEVASELAVDILAENALLINDATSLINTVRVINRSIIEAAENGRGRPGMGTTLTAALVDGTRLLLAQVGDSRAYLLHNGVLQQLTRDHSYVSELLAGGHISASEAASHPKRSVITRALGSDPKTEADIYELEASVGDSLLLCSDGLYGMVPDEEIAALLSAESDPQAASDALISAARNGGGLDNISAIVIRLNDDESSFLSFDTDEKAGRAGRGTSSLRERHGSDGRKHRLRRFHVGILSFAVLLVLLIGSAIGGVYWYASNSAFVRTEEGRVAVYRGLPGEVLPGISLQWHEYTSDVATADLLSSTAERLEAGIRVDSLNDAATLIASYEEQASRQQARRRGSSS
ncbi:MAG: Stp1/IreP family PP2C-type Ser/Thr phosphatase [Coriobacteriales bacterium]|jgi:protein phosphatase|nr:Stp1/IreP family PP2C-type Ser/Thr phosphatase [Coriobacteriales bacterium]